MTADETNPEAKRFAGNVEALKSVQPEWIEAADIEVKIGTTWIALENYEQFLYELLNTPGHARAKRTKWDSRGIQVKQRFKSWLFSDPERRTMFPGSVAPEQRNPWICI